jgi:hypothetical protein
MIIVDSPLTSAVAGTGSNCARGVRVTRSAICAALASHAVPNNGRPGPLEHRRRSRRPDAPPRRQVVIKDAEVHVERHCSRDVASIL